MKNENITEEIKDIKNLDEKIKEGESKKEI